MEVCRVFVAQTALRSQSLQTEDCRAHFSGCMIINDMQPSPVKQHYCTTMYLQLSMQLKDKLNEKKICLFFCVCVKGPIGYADTVTNTAIVQLQLK